MAAIDKDCPKCRDRMDQGFIPDHSQGILTSKWTEGEEPTSHWYGKTLKGLRQYEIEAWRCRSCGYIDLYARQEVE